MSMFQQMWAWFTGLFKSKPSVDEKVDLETVPDIAPNDDDVVPVKPQIDLIGMYADVVYFETHNDELKTLLKNPAVKLEMQAFLESADIADMVSHYSDEALAAVREHGTNWAFTPLIAAAIGSAVRAEQGKRNSSVAPDRNGMGADGFQR